MSRLVPFFLSLFVGSLSWPDLVLCLGCLHRLLHAEPTPRIPSSLHPLLHLCVPRTTLRFALRHEVQGYSQGQFIRPLSNSSRKASFRREGRTNEIETDATARFPFPRCSSTSPPSTGQQLPSLSSSTPWRSTRRRTRSRRRGA